MKELHIQLDDLTEIHLTELCKYCDTKQTRLVETLLQIAYNAAYEQVELSQKYPDKLPNEDTLTTYQTYMLMHITDIFDHLYPSAEEL